MSESLFIAKIEYSCHKKEELFNKSKAKYAIRSMFAGAFLTLSTAAGVIAADVINGLVPGTGRFVFPFIFAWGLIYILFLNAELTTSNMMYLTAGTFLKKINWKKALLILLYCTFFNLVGALFIAFLFNQTSAFSHLTSNGFLAGIAEHKLSRPSQLVIFEGIIANIFVNIAILSYLLLKNSTAKIWIVISAIYMFVFLTNEHLAANFASFSLVAFNKIATQIEVFNLSNILRHFSITFLANWIGGGLLIGLSYAFLNGDEDTYTD
ncbi:formate/nitrite transporter family protein [Streptococcus intermedius]|uniref:formate/nitrite transporter family protein n=1 Tax=Streptococcus intermedius TaxID=1338 RepID=UPI00066116C3|nr:formate/nitrite transporter family protein [Streptococcus intermedius]MCI3917337.1 formate/nitrite transporter family protein [Streptococcus intermedius]